MPTHCFSCGLLQVLSAGLVSLSALTACSPTFNWRDVRPEQTTLRLLLPCKPDPTEKTVPLGGVATTLKMLSCDAGGATFAVVMANWNDALKVEQVLAQWQSVTLANMQARPIASGLGAGSEATHVSGFKLTGAAMVPPAVLLKAQGRRRDGSAVVGQAAFFAQGSQIFQVVVYADRIRPEVSETLFSSLRFD